MSKQRHLVVVPLSDGGVEVHPLKDWLRRNPSALPGVDPGLNTSHQLRGLLIRQGWMKQETPDEYRLIPPGSTTELEAVSEMLGTDDPEGYEDSAPAAFTLEYQLRDFIAGNLHKIQIGARRIRLYEDPTGRDGVEYPTSVGPIDILAVDDEGNFIVFELKRATSPDRAIGQVARYMGWVQQTIGAGKTVSGVIVAKSISQNLRYAASVFQRVHLFEYEVQFTLQEAHQLPTR